MYTYDGELTLSRELSPDEVDMLNFVLGKRIDKLIEDMDIFDGNPEKTNWMDLDSLDFMILPNQTIIPLHNPEGTSNLYDKVVFLIDYISIVMDDVFVNGTIVEKAEIEGDDELELGTGFLTTKVIVQNNKVTEDIDIL